MEEQKFSSSSFAEVGSVEYNIFEEKLHTSAWLFQQPFFPENLHRQPRGGGTYFTAGHETY